LGPTLATHTLSAASSPAPLPPSPPPPGFEFINGYPASEAGSIWLDSTKASVSQGEYYFPPSLYSQLLGRNSTTGAAYHAYSIDWQPNAVSW
jgi:hypothetical protein